MEQQNKKAEKNDLRLVQLAQYAVPKMKEVQGTDWIYYGEKNLYPQYLLDLYSQSSTHNALINGKVNYIKGNGLVSDPDKRNAGIQGFLANINPMETADELLDKLALDFEINNGFAVEVIRTAGGKFNYYYLDFSTIRSDGKGTYFVSHNWADSYGNMNYRPDYRTLKTFDPTDRKQLKSIIYYKQHYPGCRYYPLPTYIGSIMDIETSIEIANFHLSDIKNGFWAGVMISFFGGDPDDEEAKDAIERKVKEKTSGSSNANGILINFANSPEESAKVEPLRHAELDKRFEQLRIDVVQSIFTGHRITSPMLFGLKSEGQLGGRDELGTAYELFKSTYSRGRQQVHERFFNMLAHFNGHKKTLYIEELFPVDPWIPLTETAITANLNQGEMRQVLRDKYGFDIQPNKEIIPSIAPAAPNTAMSFPEDDLLIELFEKTGSEFNGDIVAEYPVIFSEDETPMEPDELGFEILGMLHSSPGISLTAISEALHIDLARVAQSAALLIVLQFLNKSEDNYTVTPKGNPIAAKSALKLKLEVKYKYTIRDDMPPAKHGSRKFCTRMMELNKLWTREEIDIAKNDMKFSLLAPDMNVWNSRGGWYKQNGSALAVPYCRHWWKQVIVQE